MDEAKETKKEKRPRKKDQENARRARKRNLLQDIQAAQAELERWRRKVEAAENGQNKAEGRLIELERLLEKDG